MTPSTSILGLSAALALAGCGSPRQGGYGNGVGGANDHYDTPSPTGSDSPCSLGQFGACVTADKCAPGAGYLSSVSCNAGGVVCCAPLDRCTGSEDFVCCDASGHENRPVCDVPAGEAAGAPLGCPYGQVEAPPGQCAMAEAGVSCLRSGTVCDPGAPACCAGLTCVPAAVPADGGPPTPPECR